MFFKTNTSGQRISPARKISGLDLSGTLQGAGGVGGLLAASFGGTQAFYCHDANGQQKSAKPKAETRGGRDFEAARKRGVRSGIPRRNGNCHVTEYIDESGAIRAHYEYSPFGEIIAQSGDMADVFRFRFSTKYHDPETGHYYYGRRFYSPELGRWLNRDPIEEDGGLNLYGFVENNGLNHVDSLGMSMTLQNYHYNYYKNVIEPHFRELTERLTRELQALCPEKPTFWDRPSRTMKTCCQPSDCKDKAQEMAAAYVAVLKDVWLAERRKYGNVRGDLQGNRRVWRASVSWTRPWGCANYGDGYDVNDWKEGNGLKCDGWSQLINERVNIPILKDRDDCWVGRRVGRGEKSDGDPSHVWYQLQAPGGTKQLDPWPSGGWSY